MTGLGFCFVGCPLLTAPLTGVHPELPCQWQDAGVSRVGSSHFDSANLLSSLVLPGAVFSIVTSQAIMLHTSQAKTTAF